MTASPTGTIAAAPPFRAKPSPDSPSLARVDSVPPGLRSSLVGIAVVGAAIPAFAFAQDAQVQPRASSPAGAVYEIPLQTARRDAAPQRTSDGRKTNAVAGSGEAGGGGSGGGGVLPQGS